jgi:hypothetical protein
MGVRQAILALMASCAMLGVSHATEIVDSTEADLSCLVASLHLMNSSVPEQSQAGIASFLYWLGRVDGGAPDLDLETRIANLSPAFTNEHLNAELVRCGTEMQTRGAEVQAIGDRLQARGL